MHFRESANVLRLKTVDFRGRQQIRQKGVSAGPRATPPSVNNFRIFSFPDFPELADKIRLLQASHRVVDESLSVMAPTTSSKANERLALLNVLSRD